MAPVRYSALLTVGLLVGIPAHHAEAGDIEMGRSIAEEYCVQCHSIGADGKFKMDPPSFAAIAKFRSQQQIKQLIESPRHQDMPRYSDYMISGNIDDMVAYIVSLEN
ncbi:MAG: cytochrome c [Ruegeria sp.]